MLCPEVWNFSSPASSVFCRQYETQESLSEFIKQQHFNHHISITLPNSLYVPEELKNLLQNDTDFYKVEKIPAFYFIQKDFIDLFIRKGHLTALSVKDYSGRTDTLRCTPDGKIILSFTKETYHELGLTANNVSKKSTSKSYYLTIDVKLGDTNIGNNVNQIKTKLKQCKNLLTFDVILTWDPEDTKICPSSIALYVTKQNFLVKTCTLKSESRCEYNTVVPVYNNSLDCSDFVEYLGAFGLQCKIDLDNYLSSFKCPEESEHLGQVSYLSSTGLISTNRINRIISSIRNYINADSNNYWIAVIVTAFRNTIRRKKNNRLYFDEGDQHYCLIFKKGNPVLVYSYQASQN